MPELVLTIGGLIFSAGIAWGIFSFRQGKIDDQQSNLVKDLKECVGKLQNVVTEVEVMKTTSRYVEKITEDHEKRIHALEVQTSRRKRAQ